MRTGKIRSWYFPLFLILSVIAVAQLSWWVIYQVQEGSRIQKNQHLIWDQQIALAEEAIGLSPEITPEEINAEILKPFPDLKLSGNNEINITEEALERLDNTARKRVRMFVFEGSFFGLLVIIGVWAMYWALRRKQELENQTVELISSAANGIKEPLSTLKDDITELTGSQNTEIAFRAKSSVEKIYQTCDRVGMVQFLAVGRRKVSLSLTNLSDLNETLFNDISASTEADGFNLAVNNEKSISAITNIDRWTTMVRNMAHVMTQGLTGDSNLKIDFQREGDVARLVMIRKGVSSEDTFSESDADIKLIVKLAEIIGGNLTINQPGDNEISIAVEIPVWEENE